jgi:hypothetical protein
VPHKLEANMAMVVIRCPVTGRPAFTGIETDAGSVNFIPPVNARLKCPCCGDTHVWSILEAELVTGEADGTNDMPAEWASRLAKIDARAS